jgi:crotonobetainyl-CoA:carnitine CoA-transferase CaiB-like acyl-CoA transferase
MIDVALIEPIYHLLGGQTTIFDQLGTIQSRSGNRSVNNAPRNTYKTRDGRWVAMSTASQSIAERVMGMIGHPGIAKEPWFSSGAGRAKHADELDALVGAWIGERDHDAVMAAFEEAGAAVAPIYDIKQLIDDPQYQALNSVISLPDEDLGTVRMQNLPFRMSAGAGAVKHGGRRLGQDTDSVLRDVLGMSETDLQSLHNSGVTQPTP